MNTTQILLIEDDQSIAELVMLHLTSLEYQVDHAANYVDGEDLALNRQYDLILLDLMLPGGEGMIICRKLRLKKNQTPLIIVTAKTEEIDKVLGLESGADDYITKPFSIRELLARVKAAIRRSTISIVEDGNDTYQFDNLTIDACKRKVVLNQQTIDLTKKEFELLYLLAANKGVSFSREKLLDLIWGYQFEGYDHTVNSHINRLRAKIELEPSKPKFILTSWGIGYKFNDEI